jgi:hypothetical protein
MSCLLDIRLKLHGFGKNIKITNSYFSSSIKEIYSSHFSESAKLNSIEQLFTKLSFAIKKY